MFELLSLLFGGALRLVPSVLEYLDAKNKRSHEIEMLKAQVEADRMRSEFKMQEKEVDAIAKVSAAQSGSFVKTGRPWIDIFLALVEAFSATVRPVLTYWYCVLMYGAYKAALYYTMIDIGQSWKDAAVTLWTPTDYAIMLSVTGFWFVDRSLRKLRDSK